LTPDAAGPRQLCARLCGGVAGGESMEPHTVPFAGVTGAGVERSDAAFAAHRCRLELEWMRPRGGPRCSNAVLHATCAGAGDGMGGSVGIGIGAPSGSELTLLASRGMDVCAVSSALHDKFSVERLDRDSNCNESGVPPASMDKSSNERSIDTSSEPHKPCRRDRLAA